VRARGLVFGPFAHLRELLMALRDRMALSAAPLFLRIGLGVTFLWAGLGKLLSDMPVQGQDAAILANLGVNIGAGTPPQPKTLEAPESPKVSAPEAKPAEPAPAETPAEKPAEKPTDKGTKSLDGKKSDLPPVLMAFIQAPKAAADAKSGPSFSMADFPEPRPVKTVYHVALGVWKSGNPAPDATGKPLMRLVPDWAGQGSWPIRLAWAAAIAETLGGTLVLVGLFTRLSALTLAWTIGVACWLTVIGPAVQSGETALGFLPRHGRFDPAWMMPLWHLSLLTGALALFFAGPGGASLDSVIFAKDPSPHPKPKPAE